MVGLLYTSQHTTSIYTMYAYFDLKKNYFQLKFEVFTARKNYNLLLILNFKAYNIIGKLS